MALSGKRIVKRSRIAVRADAALLAALAGRDDAMLEAEAVDDRLCAPVEGPDAWRGAEMIEPETTVLVTLRIERAVYDAYERQGPNFEVRMAEALRRHVEAARDESGGG